MIKASCRVGRKKREDVFNEPLNNGDIFNFQNLIGFWLVTPKRRFSCINIQFSFSISRYIKS